MLDKIIRIGVIAILALTVITFINIARGHTVTEPKAAATWDFTPLGSQIND